MSEKEQQDLEREEDISKDDSQIKSPGNERVIHKLIQDEMKTAYVTYAMSVIVGRALPDVRDGLKPVHRRILYAMYDMGMLHNKSFKKCARIVGEVLGKYHPHGDTAVYDSLVRMAQEFSLRYPLVFGQGNFGSIDGDNAAAMRYCVTGNTLILTDKGLIPITVLAPRNGEKISNTVLSYKGKKNPAIKFFNSGSHNIIKTKTKLGYELKGSHNHPILCWTLNEFGAPHVIWKQLSEITTKDHVLINRNYSLFSKTDLNLKSSTPKPSNKQKNISLPTKMNKSLAFLLGALVSEGSFHQNKIIFNNKDIKFYNTVKDSILKNFKGTKLYERNIKGDCQELDFYLQRPVNFLKNIGLKSVRSNLKEIPFSVLQSKKESVREFLIALFEGDGSVQLVTDKRHGGKSLQLCYHSNSKKLIFQLKTLLLNFGIITTKPYTDKRNGCYKLSISGVENILQFKNQIGFFSDRKNKILDNIDSINKTRLSKNDSIPHLNNYLRKNYSQSFIKRTNFDRYNSLEQNYTKLISIIKPSDKSLVDWLLKHQYFFDKVSSTKKLTKKETVFSVKVNSNCHSFVANGFVNHNTEAKLQKLSEELLKDIEKDTVDFKENFDGSLKEPTVLPSKIPNLLVNGSSGIAVGMATNIPPHNLREVCSALIELIDNSEITVEELIQHVPGPDFPTGAEIYVGAELLSGYRKGRGKVIIKSVVDFEDQKIIINEIPYQVNKADLIIQIAELVKNKRIIGIRNINDESDREGIRVVIDLKRDADPQVVLNQLYKFSRMRISFSLNMLALVNNEPKLLSLKDFLWQHILHRREVVTRRTAYDLRKAEERLHVLEGLMVAINNLDDVIPGIRASNTVEDAKIFLTSNYDLSDIQAKAILDLKLQKLASLEQEKIKTEHKNLFELAKSLGEILASSELIDDIIKKEFVYVSEKYGDERKSKILIGQDGDLTMDMEDLIEESIQVVTITNSGYMKRLPLDTYRTQNRGGKGVIATSMKDKDFVEKVRVVSTHSYLLIFTDSGIVHWIKVYQIPEGSRQSRGRHVANLVQLGKDENISAIVAVRNFEEGYLFMATKNGTVKKTDLKLFSKPRRGGIRAIDLEEGNSLIGVKYTDGKKEILLATKNGRASRFNESEVRSMGRTAKGVRGIRISENDQVISLLVANNDAQILTLTEKGYGKRTPVSEYRLCHRGSKGVTNIKITDKNGKVVVAMIVEGSEDLMLISKNGIAIRVKCNAVSMIGRATQGVRVMRMKDLDTLAASAKIRSEDDEVEDLDDNDQPLNEVENKDSTEESDLKNESDEISSEKPNLDPSLKDN